MFFPMSTVERSNLDVSNRPRFQTAYVYAVTVGMGPRHIKRLDAANLAEEVSGDAGIERVTRKRLLSTDQSKPIFGHDQMQKTALATDRAVTFDRFNIGGRLHLELHTAAVAPAFMSHGTGWF